MRPVNSSIWPKYLDCGSQSPFVRRKAERQYTIFAMSVLEATRLAVFFPLILQLHSLRHFPIPLQHDPLHSAPKTTETNWEKEL